MPPLTKTALSLCGSGFLGLYHVGVIQALQVHAAQWRPRHILGASAGSLVAAAATCKVDTDAITERILGLCELSRAQAAGCLTPGFSLVSHLGRYADALLPYNAHELAQANGLVVSVSDFAQFPPRNVLVREFSSRSFLLDALLASASIPGVTCTVREARARPRVALDGGLTNNWPCLREEDTVFASPFSGVFDVHPTCTVDGRLAGAARFRVPIQGHTVDLSALNVHQLKQALHPKSAEYLAGVVAQGHENMTAYLDRSSCHYE